MITGISRFTKGEFNQAALDEVYSKGKELYKDPIAPPSSGIIENTTQFMWDDMNEPNTGWVSAMPSSFGQFQGPVKKDINNMPFYNSLNIWVEIEAAGDGSGCSLDMNQSVNTRVEFGWTKGYILTKNNQWIMFGESQNYTQPQGEGSQYPIPTGAGTYHGIRSCPSSITDIIKEQIDNNYPTAGFEEIESSGFKSVKPQSYFRYHGWAKPAIAINDADIIGVHGQCYLRLIKDDPNGVDDRHLANFVVHISSDIRNLNLEDSYIGDIGISRYKTITNDWEAINFLSLSSSMTEAQFLANPPPVSTTP